MKLQPLRSTFLLILGCFLTIFFSPCAAEPLLNLEDMAQDFVLETKQIKLPGYTTAFNPTMLRWKGALLLCYRIRNPLDENTNGVGLSWLDEDFNPIGSPYVLEITADHPTIPSKVQDPRLVVVADKLYVVYSNNIPGENLQAEDYTAKAIPVSLGLRRMFVGEVLYDGKTFRVVNPDCLTSFEGEKSWRWEKNWVPFDYKGNLLLAYSLLPHYILMPLIGTGHCETIASTTGNITWDWGTLRGGTPALEHNGEYLAFFHSSKALATTHSNGKKMDHYVMGAYTFSLDPPFTITKISPEPIVAKKFYDGPPHKTWKPLRVVFPCGFVFDDNYIWISYGRQDHEIWIVKLNKQGLLNSLAPVEPRKGD